PCSPRSKGGFASPFFRILHLAAIVCSCASQLVSYLRVWNIRSGKLSRLLVLQYGCAGRSHSAARVLTIFTVGSFANLFGRLSIQCCERVVEIKRAKFP